MSHAVVDLAPMRTALQNWAEDHLPGGGALSLERLAAGHSNLTFVLRREGVAQEWILRRPPLGPLLPSAHDVLREAKVIALLSGQGVRVPTVVGHDDGEVLGAPFYVMDRLPGEVVRRELPDWLSTEAKRRHLGLDLVDAMAEVHQVDPEPLVRARLGRPGGYLTRQLQRWTAQHEGLVAMAHQSGLVPRELPHYERVRAWLADRLAALDEVARVAVVHGDLKLDNAIVDPQTCSVTALLDWEMATVGDPLADLGYLLAMSPRPDLPSPMDALTGSVTATPGFPSRDETVERYVQRTGARDSDLITYEVLALWKMATLLEMSYYRYLAGTTDDPLFPELEWGVPAICVRAAERMGSA